MALCDTYLDDIAFAYEMADWAYDTFITPHADWLVGNYSTSAFNLAWRTHVALSISNLRYAVEYLIHCNTLERHPLRLPYYLENCIAAEPPALTMDDILSAMVTATPEQVMYFVGLADAYRVSVWDMPFNEEFYAALARGFKQWP